MLIEDDRVPLRGLQEKLQPEQPVEEEDGYTFLEKLGTAFLLENSIERRSYLQERLDSKKLRIITGPLQLIAVSPHNINCVEAEGWSIATKAKLMDKNFMLSRPKYNGRNYLKAVLGNPHTNFSHLEELAHLLNNSI